jgi:hypothetical protein
VKFFTRGLVLFILSLGMFVVVGCGNDNEAEAEQLAKAAGDPGSPDPKAVRKEGPQPTSSEEHYQNQLKNDPLKGGKYPGAKKSSRR